MCTVSMVIDDYTRRQWPEWMPKQGPFIPDDRPSREELDEVKRQLEELKKLIKAAKKYDEATHQPDCEDAEKMALLKKLANLIGVNLNE